MNNDDDYARVYKFVPGSTLGASIITAVALHYFFPIATVIPFPYNLLGLLIVGFGMYLAFQSVRLLISHNTTVEAGGNPSSLVKQCPYGLIDNTWVQDTTKTIGLTSTGMSIAAPKSGDDVNALMRKALETPEVFRDFLNSINGRVIPAADVCKNTLIRQFHVLNEDAVTCYNVLMQNIQELKITQETPQGKSYLRLDKLSKIQTAPQAQIEEEEGEVSSDSEPEIETGAPAGLTQPEVQAQKTIPKKIFVAHGKNQTPLAQLKDVLNQFKVPFQVAIDEAHKGRPIGKKVEELMRGCTSGIFIFTADEEISDGNGGKVYRPSDNVVFELGAGIILYGDKIVILREQDVSFGSDFRDFGHITFEKDKLDAKALDLMKELIGLGFLQVTPT
jgi:predicted nucleotide-binding protein